jgi:hypothetical protein
MLYVVDRIDCMTVNVCALEDQDEDKDKDEDEVWTINE